MPVEGYRFGDPGSVPDSGPARPSPESGDGALWNGHFNDPRLSAWIERALRNNPDLSATAARLDAAAARVGQVHADRLPGASLSADGARSRSNQPSSRGVVPTTANRFEILGSVSWEIDLWGRLRDESAAAVASFESDRAALEFARLSLASSVAASYYAVVAAEARVHLRRSTAKSLRRTLEVVEGRFERGLTTAFDVRSARADLDRAEATLSAARNQVQTERRSLEVLSGDLPRNQPAGASTLPQIPSTPPAGLPADLLVRRPDIRAAAFEVEQAARQLSASEKVRLPSIELTGNAGRAAADLGDLSHPDFNVWGIAARAVAPVYQGGRIRAGIEEAEARRAAAAATYRGTVLQAFNEVETALAADALLKAQLTSLESAADEAKAAEALALDQYARGLADITTVLNAQRRTFDVESSRIDVHLARIQNRLNLLLAIGDPALPPFSTPAPTASSLAAVSTD